LLALARRKISYPLDAVNKERQEHKETCKKKIIAMFERQEKVTNDDVEKMLFVSNRTAAAYLDELEREGKIIQNGTTGKWVFYSKI
jgi:predicted HTH transcriptional regulator